MAWDIGAAELTRGLAGALGAPAVLAGYSRLVVDCNRPPDDAEAFRTVSDGHEIPGNRALTEFDRAQRLACFFDPYHEAIGAMLAGFRLRDVVPLLVSVHTFTPTMGGSDRPWHVGVLWDRDEASARYLICGAEGRGRDSSSATTSPTAASIRPTSRCISTPSRPGCRTSVSRSARTSSSRPRGRSAGCDAWQS